MRKADWKAYAGAIEQDCEVMADRALKAEAERDEARAALRHLRDHYEPSVGTNYVCAGMAEYVCEVANRVLLNGEDE